MKNAIELKNVSKTYGKGQTQVHAVRDLSLTIEAGQVFGFLGPNGAGKSTTIRMLMNLIFPTAGEVYLFGQNVQQQPYVLKRVGALVEGAQFYEFLTGRKNLELLATLSECADLNVVDTLLAKMGMADRADRPVKGYSTGMRQRLGIAAAMLHDPDLVILDEPTNGLDPAGIQEIRHFIRELAEKLGKTVFLSSHLLSEVEQTCDRVAIINRGKILTEGSVQSLVEKQNRVAVEVDSVEHGTAVLSPHWQLETDNQTVIVTATRDETPKIIELLVQQQVNIYQVKTEQQNLEEVFLSLTSEDQI